ncbi:MAG: porphobilinogen synthase [Gemmatimonadetes bacterium]|nr:porphobilinogen synthase [Gemmatimonadota bacterium]
MRASFPSYRPRRLRRTERLRRLVRENELSPEHLIAPLFVIAGRSERRPVESMPGVEQLSADLAAEKAQGLRELGVGAVILFGIPESKDPGGSGAYDPEGVVQDAVRLIKAAAPDLLVVSDVCLCEYTTHGHCGLVTPSGEVDNDATLEVLARVAVSQARAGADLVAPSDMMDGRVAAIRSALDAEGFAWVPIMSYAVKYASAFYGPFREAAESAPKFGDRRGYQMDPANAEEALREAWLDISEGADILMVKPALPYLDIVRRVKEATGYPVCAYHVSGEYSMLKAASARGWIDETAAMLESLLAIRRAGADCVITYFAEAAARRLRAG